MRIGELAALVGVSTRTVRHYHQLGLLPEPVRLPNGYREYRLRDAVVLARVRRLAELGLSLEEIRDVLADDQGKELREVLAELDADLARQQEAIALRRARLAALLAEADLHPDSTVSPDVAALLRDLSSGGTAVAAIDREMLALVDTAADPVERERMIGMLRPLTEPEALARGHELYRRIDELAGAELDDPRIPPLAADLVAHLPGEMAAAMVEHMPRDLGSQPVAATSPPGPRESGGGAWLEALATELSPAQIEVFVQAMTIVKESA
ncbi:MerR family transcriptional regulator [Planobispora rosea]|uniref:MerR family transcriptional regulator n=1 Tax=Planobispora rosea TaxID=35762 RepID=A0A8J3RXT5_PLARO|nr:MerR family transcriptional regulator [Planobispora rosea]GGS70481.1 MerR family transcriptional regulator [Planobispora rosea]GIH83280.1 MerR family transcriptional regulator [Planobispora rosea]